MPRLHAALVAVAIALALGAGGCGGAESHQDTGLSETSGNGTADSADDTQAGPSEADATSTATGTGWVPVLVSTVQVVPASNLPPETATMPSNNNLDVILHEGRIFFAWRTAPDHFASAKTELHIVSSDDDGATWRFEGSLARGTDLREPRFVSVGGALWLYFAVLGNNPTDFLPQGTMATRWQGPADWNEPVWALEKGFIPWRARTIEGLAWLIGYAGGEHVYEEGGSLAIQWLTSTDGATWGAAVGSDPVVLTGGGSEADFAFLTGGAVVAVVRNEAGDADGYGSKICRAEAEALADWRCETDPRKYDSPLVFKHADDVWLVARRNVTETGWYDLGHDLEEGETEADRYLDYQLAYWQSPKRCALWRVDADALTVHHVLDLPSGGDTCFASVLARGDHTFTLFDYSSPVDEEETATMAWIEGQLGETRIYRHELVFEPATR